MFLPALGKQIQGERDLSSNNRIIRISAGSNTRESTVTDEWEKVSSLKNDEFLGKQRIIFPDQKITARESVRRTE